MVSPAGIERGWDFAWAKVVPVNAHAGGRTRVTSMGGLYDAATLRALTGSCAESSLMHMTRFAVCKMLCSFRRGNAHAGSRSRVTSMGGLYDAATLRARTCIAPRHGASSTTKVASVSTPHAFSHHQGLCACILIVRVQMIVLSHAHTLPCVYTCARRDSNPGRKRGRLA